MFLHSNTILDSLQLNVGIIAACASFLKPLLGRLLKLNTTAAYPTYPKYGRSYRTPIGSKYASGSRRTTLSPYSDFESQCKGTVFEMEPRVSSPVARPHAVPMVSAGGSHDDFKNPPNVSSDNIQLLPMEPARGIVRTREYTVMSHPQWHDS